MSDEKIQAFLDELTALSHKHGLAINSAAYVFELEPEDSKSKYFITDNSELYFDSVEDNPMVDQRRTRDDDEQQQPEPQPAPKPEPKPSPQQPSQPSPRPREGGDVPGPGRSPGGGG